MNWQQIILHHTATTAVATVESIRKYHVENNGWLDIGYHYLVDFNGNVFEGRPLDMPGAHATGYNKTAIGIAAIGDFELFKMPELQKKGIIKLVTELMAKYNITADNILLHRDVNITACPGENFPADEILSALKGGGVVPGKTETWKDSIMQEAIQKGLITSPDHKPDDPAPKWFVLEVCLKMLRRLGK